MPEELFHEGPEELYDPDAEARELLAQQDEETDLEYARQRRLEEPGTGLHTVGEILPAVWKEIDDRRERLRSTAKESGSQQ